MNTLIVGGRSGLGLALGQALVARGESVTVTGRRELNEAGIKSFMLDLSDPSVVWMDLTEILKKLPTLDRVVFSAGFAQESDFTGLPRGEILEMINVSLLSAIMVFHTVLKRQGSLAEAVVITSTSQFTPRPREAVYTAAKAGLGMFARSLAQDPAIGKMLVVAPGGMDTPFWPDGKDTQGYLNPKDVASTILQYNEPPFAYRCIRIPRNGPVEIVEEQI